MIYLCLLLHPPRQTISTMSILSFQLVSHLSVEATTTSIGGRGQVTQVAKMWKCILIFSSGEHCFDQSCSLRCQKITTEGLGLVTLVNNIFRGSLIYIILFTPSIKGKLLFSYDSIFIRFLRYIILFLDRIIYSL